MAVRHVPAEYRSIQAAVDAAAPGDTIRVAGGVYAGPVIVGRGKDRLTIMGDGAERVTLRGEGAGPGFLLWGSGGVTIAGFTVAGFFRGFEVATSDNVIRDVVIEGNVDDGIWIVAGASRNLVHRVVARRNDDEGIEIDGTHNYVIRCDLQDNNDDGVDINADHNLALGIRATDHHRGDTPTGLIVEGRDVRAIANELSGNGAGLVWSSPEGLAVGNVIRRSLLTGVFAAAGVTHTLLLANESSRNQDVGFWFEGGSGNRLIRNEAEENGDEGIELSVGSTDFVVDDNRAKENGRAGIRLGEDTTMNAVRRNKLKENNPEIEVLAAPGAGNVLDENRCETSEPPGLCLCDG